MSHIPVLYEECLAALKLERKGILIADGPWAERDTASAYCKEAKRS